MKMESAFLQRVLAVEEFPINTALCGDVLMVNMGGPSPDWVLELHQTKAGRVLLARVLGRIVTSHCKRKLKEMEDGKAEDPADAGIDGQEVQVRGGGGGQRPRPRGRKGG